MIAENNAWKYHYILHNITVICGLLVPTRVHYVTKDLVFKVLDSEQLGCTNPVGC